MDAAILTMIILGGLTLFATRWLSMEVTALLIIAALALTGILEPSEALQGFSSTATVTVAAMFVVGAGLSRTGAIEILTHFLARYCMQRPSLTLLIFAGIVGIASAFVNNTPVVVIMVPVLLRICRGARVHSSTLFMPISFFSILGGTCTLLGTSTNILIDDLFRKSGGAGFEIFDFTAIGSVYMLVGVGAIIVLAPRLLPHRDALAALIPSERSACFVTEFVLGSESKLVGQRVSEIFGLDESIHLLELIRGESIILRANAEYYVLEPNDALIVEGSPKHINAFLNSCEGVELASVVEDEHRVPMKTIQLKLVEAVILPDSPFTGRYVASLGLNRLYGVKVMAVQRHGRQHRYQIRQMRLQPGDVLLLQADDHGLAALRETGAVLIVEGVEQTIYRRGRMPLAIAIMAGVVTATAVLGAPLVISALVGAALMMLTRCVRVDEAVRALDLSILMLLAGTIPLGVAMLKTGLAQQIVHGAMGLIGESRPWVLLSALYILTAILSAFLSNNAAAVILAPIAIDMAAVLGVDPRPLLMAVAFGASASFATPIGYQTNAIVMGPGGYTFGDFLRLGIPLTIIMWIAATILIPIFWPL